MLVNTFGENIILTTYKYHVIIKMQNEYSILQSDNLKESIYEKSIICIVNIKFFNHLFLL